MTNEDLMYSSPEDQAFYLKCVEGLPTLAGLNGTGKDEDGIPLPYGCGPHSVRCLREIVEAVSPKHIMEIGFNMGWSAAMWLELAPNARLVSCDISQKKETLAAAEMLTIKYKGRFHYFDREEEDVELAMYALTKQFDLIFIDGSHLLDDVVKDIQFAIDVKIPYIAFDDYLPQFGEVQEAIAVFPSVLELIKVIGNIALYKNTTIYERVSWDAVYP